MSSRDPYDDGRDDDGLRDRDDGYDDYQDEPRRRGRAWAAQKVALPAIFLMIVGALGFGFTIVRTALYFALGPQPNPFANPNAPNAAEIQKLSDFMEAVGPFINLAWSIIVFFGGLQLKRLRSRGFVIFSCAFAMLPCNLVCLLGIPFGIWGLVAACDQGVKQAINARAARLESY